MVSIFCRIRLIAGAFFSAMFHCICSHLFWMLQYGFWTVVVVSMVAQWSGLESAYIMFLSPPEGII